MQNYKPEKFLKLQVLSVVFACLTILLALGAYIVETINSRHLHQGIEDTVRGVDKLFKTGIETQALQLEGMLKIITDDPLLKSLLKQQDKAVLFQKYQSLY